MKVNFHVDNEQKFECIMAITERFTKVIANYLEALSPEMQLPENYGRIRSDKELIEFTDALIGEILGKFGAECLMYDCTQEMAIEMSFQDILIVQAIGVRKIKEFADTLDSIICPPKRAA